MRYRPGVINESIGILGGGQLARMLALDAHPLGIEPRIFTARADDPAARVCAATTVGELTDVPALRRFLKTCDALTFESEFVDVARLRRVLPARARVFPSLDALEIVQDRLTQKQLLDQHDIPTSPWREVDDDVAGLHRDFPRGFVMKARRFGYDGTGTFVVRPGGTPDPRWTASLKHGLIVEALQNFRRELAISFVRSRAGEFRVLPLVESVQVDARCFSVRGPVTHPGLARLVRQFKKVMNDLDYVGILAVELFDVGGRLLVNELAPRVHNSAHYASNALTCSQFEYHLRAGLGLPLPKVALRAPAFAMVNLLGEGGRVRLNYAHDGWLHWYGKSENREGRKLGHLNVIDRTPARALARALRWLKDIEL